MAVGYYDIVTFRVIVTVVACFVGLSVCADVFTVFTLCRVASMTKRSVPCSRAARVLLAWLLSSVLEIFAPTEKYN